MTVGTITRKDDAVRLYSQAGFTLFAIGQSKNAKAPAYKGWQQTEFNPSRELPPMFAVLLRECDLVLDHDPSRGPDELIKFISQFGLPPLETCFVATQSGGHHIYFKLPPGFDKRLPAKVPGYPSIDIKHKGGYVIAAGSTYKDKAYSFARLNPLTIAECPQSILAALSPKDKETNGNGHYLEAFMDDEGTRKRFIDFIRLPKNLQGSSYEIACEGRGYGLPPETIVALMLEHLNPLWENPLTEDECKAKVAHAFSYGQTETGALSETAETFDAIREQIHTMSQQAQSVADLKWQFQIDKQTGSRIAQPSLNNGVNYFTLPQLTEPIEPNPLLNLIAYNEFSCQMEFTRPAPWHTAVKTGWEDTDTTELQLFLSRRCHFEISNQKLIEVITIASQHNKFHPVRTWLDSLEWDGVPRLDEWLPTYVGTANSEYSRAIGKNTLIAAVDRAYNPGCQHDSMLVLEGPQGSGKSMACKILGGSWFTELPIMNLNKVPDVVAIMCGSWVIELPEMEFTRHAEIRQLKGFLSCKTDRVRLPYARFPINLPRQSIFIGTTNPDPEGYLRDTTGNRRFWPIWTGKIDLKSLSADRNQLFAEAVARFKIGENHYLDQESLIAIASEETKKRMSIDIWQDVIEDWINRLDGKPLHFTTAQIAEQGLNLVPAKMDRVTKMRISQAMHNLGYEWRSARVNGLMVKVFKKASLLDEV